MNSNKKAPQWHKKCTKWGSKNSVQMYYNPLFFQTEDIQHSAFLCTDIGQLYQSIPFKTLATKIPLPAYEKSGRGRKPFLKVEGGIALMLLKHYLGLSDELLIERLNTDWCMQYFCGVQLSLRKIKDKNLVSIKKILANSANLEPTAFMLPMKTDGIATPLVLPPVL